VRLTSDTNIDQGTILYADHMNRRDQLEHVKEQVNKRLALTESLVIQAVNEAEVIEKDIRKAMSEALKASKLREETISPSITLEPIKVDDRIEVVE